ncbi:MAG TPA: hypothetical protein VFM55_18940 [Micromonosporaceae bacterium]|nr:hypothetical protein [Micromonosporaceae bacterium]
MELFLIALIAFEVLSGGFFTSAFAGAATEGAKAAWGETSKGAKSWYGKRAKRMKKTRMGRWRLRTEATVAGGLAFLGRGVAAGAKAAPGGANKGRKARHAIRRKAVAKARAGGRQMLATGGAKVQEWRTRGGPDGAGGGPVADPGDGGRDTPPADAQPWWRRPGDPAPDPRAVVTDGVVHKDDPGTWRELEHYGRRESGNGFSRCPDCLGQGCGDCDGGAIDGHVIDDLERRAWRDRDLSAAQDLVRIRRADPRLVPTSIEDPEAHANGWTRDEAGRARLLQAMVDKAEETGQDDPGLRGDLDKLQEKALMHRAEHGDREAAKDLVRRRGMNGHGGVVQPTQSIPLADGARHAEVRDEMESLAARGRGTVSPASDPAPEALPLGAAITAGAVRAGQVRPGQEIWHTGEGYDPIRGEVTAVDRETGAITVKWDDGHVTTSVPVTSGSSEANQTTPPTGGGNDTNHTEGAPMAEERGVRPYLATWETAPDALETQAASVQQHFEGLQAAAEVNAKHEVGGIDVVVAAGNHAVEALKAYEEKVRAHKAALNAKWTPDMLRQLDATESQSGQELAGAH